MYAPPDVLEFIASRVSNSIRELEGALIRVTAFASLTRSVVELSLAEEVLRDFMPDGAGPEITADQIMVSTADYFGVSLEDLRLTSVPGAGQRHQVYASAGADRPRCPDRPGVHYRTTPGTRTGRSGRWRSGARSTTRSPS
jgi:hypothetical protein